ncbi:PD-(D/E)XK motif protein [Streptomyces sp. NPDC048389]|uniref:PD-(D/E)XK motif protein n=1 Tax=Streptomyces sp. NPDC048389 TaxID=3154622 RepID=UPI0034566637
MNIDEELWLELEEPQAGQGRSTRRVYPESPHDIHVSVTHPGRRRMLLLKAGARAADGIVRSVGELPRTAGLDLCITAQSRHEYELQVSLTADELREVFTPLVSDIASAVKDAPTTETALEAAVRRFSSWQQLLRTVGKNGLTADTRRGLFGELYFLNEYVLPSVAQTPGVQAWTGPGGSNQDFQLPDVAVEVKTTTAKNPRTVRVASERQLDSTGTPALLLTLMSVDERRGGSGESLNALVDRIRHRLTNPAARSRLDSLLIQVGYLPGHRDLYDEPRYTLRQAETWEVREGFPRLIESELPAGVGDCTYNISTSALDDYRVTTDQVTAFIRGTDG